MQGIIQNIFTSGIIQGGLVRAIERSLEHGRAMLLLEGMWMTIRISLGAILLGLVIGSIVVTLKLSKFRVLRAIALVYLGIIRGTPSVTQLLIVNFTIFAGVRGAGMWVGIVALGINSGAYVAEIIRAGIMSVDKGQREAGLSLGFTRFQTMRYIILPQAIKNIIPTFVNEFIVLIKETAIVGFVGVSDVTRVATQIMTRTFDVTPIFISAIMYLTLISILTMLLGLLEKKLRESDRDGPKKRIKRKVFQKGGDLS